MPIARILPLRRISWQLPLAIAALLLMAVGVFSWAAHREVRLAVVAGAGDRLDHAARRLAALLEENARARLVEMRGWATSPAVRRAVASGREPGGSAAAVLRRVLEASQQTDAVEVWASTGRSLVAVERASDAPVVNAGTYPVWAGDSSAVSGFRRYGDTLRYELAVPVRAGNGSTGYLVQRRRLSPGQQAARLIAELIGSRAAVLIGQPGGLWTDLSGPVTGPPAGATRGIREYSRAGTRRFAALMPVHGTPWVVGVELPLGAVAAPADAFVRSMLPVGALIVVLGAALGFGLSGRITRPLDRIHRAATAMAAGDLDQRVPPRGPGELRRLAQSFNAMAERVGAARHGLEEQIVQRTDALRRYAADLETVNRELEAFSYSVSHDLRSPLRAIHGFSQALLEDQADRLDPQGVEYLQRVRAAADRMGRLIDDLLELSRVTRSEMRTEAVDLTGLAHRVVGELRQGPPARRVEVRISEGLVAMGDQRLLRLALQNLLDNAWKFTARREHATIEVGRRNGPDPAFYVRDDGAGFDMTYAGKLFGVFQRLHAESEFPGTGVGLAIVQRVVHRHGGRVWAEGAPGRGATFYFTLPTNGGG
ncbi:MAG TPA: ATP-binding protein [Gemmatimonadales bacterium]|nr:ATP-binding protein [Gemmatimonadales bacterium]